MLENILLVISVLLIALVLVQSNKATDAGKVMMGGNDAMYQNLKERGFEAFLTKFTLVVGLTFFVISFILFVQ